ncbi:hypothetical protein HYR69_02860 [Candidatus Sumerlaeota bacterium]|nr:hypothetical protein [Candidatus Sumerlaeota bacterium]
MLQTTAPYTGDKLYDTAILVLFFFFGVWVIVRYNNKIGWFIIVVSMIWAYQLYSYLLS